MRAYKWGWVGGGLITGCILLFTGRGGGVKSGGGAHNKLEVYGPLLAC